MSKREVEILGDKEILRRLRAMGDEASVVLEPAAMAGSDIVVEAAEQLAPRRTAFLARHIIKELIEKSAVEVIVAVGPHKDAFWGPFQELGTPHHPAQPFMRPALEEKAEEIAAAIGQAVWEALERKTK